MRTTLVISFLLMSLTALPVAAATFDVNDGGDAADATPGDGHCETSAHVCTLRAAVQEANALAGADVITVPAGTYVLSSGALALTEGVTITGAGAVTTILDGNAADRVFDVPVGVIATIEDLTVTNGRPSSGNGGGIRNRGTLTLTRVTIRNNVVAGSTGVFDDPIPGGGAVANAGTLTVDHCSLVGNRVLSTDGGEGGGIRNQSETSVPGASVTVTDSLIGYNSVANYGGGIFNGNYHGVTGALTVVRSTLVGNQGDSSGGIDNRGTMTVLNTTITNNGSSKASASLGAGVANFGTGTLRNVTITRNVGLEDPGVAFDSADTIGVSNPQGTLSIANSIIAEHTENCLGTITSLGHNLIQASNTCILTGDTATDLSVGDPKLGTLAFDGGPTPTRLPLPGSPVIDAGSALASPDAGACEATDQRGQTRPAGARCDIGAVEVGAPVTPPAGTTFTVDDTGTAPDAHPGDGVCATSTGACTLVAAIQEANASPGPDVVQLAAATYSLDHAQEQDPTYGATGLPSVTDDLTIVGSGADATAITRSSAAPTFRIFRAVAGSLTLRNLAVGGGAAAGSYGGGILAWAAPVTLTGVRLEGNSAAFGAAIEMLGDTLTLDASTVKGNLTSDRSVSHAVVVTAGLLDARCTTFAQNTGALRINDVGPNVGTTHHIAGCTFSDSTGVLAALEANGHSTTIVDISESQFTNGVATASGGGLYLRALTARISNSTFSDNAGQEGGAIDTDFGAALQVDGCTFSGNSVTDVGGAVVTGGPASFTNCTFSGNAATGGGGAIYAQGDGPLVLRNVTMAGNRATAAPGGGLTSLMTTAPSIADSIIAGNTDAGGTAPDCLSQDPVSNNPAQLPSLGHNIFGNGSGCDVKAGAGDLIGTPATPVDPLLGTLGDHGGFTETMVPGTGSPAVDGGDPLGCMDATGAPLTVDQRGVPRSKNPRCDIGAVEVSAAAPPPAVSVCDATATTSTTLPTTSPTTTTLPSGAEICGNCVDDDGNGLTDFEDPACCPATGDGLIVKGAKIKPKGGAYFLRLSTALTNGDVDPSQQDVFVEIRPASGADVLCARLPAAQFARKKQTFRFLDPTHTDPTGAGLDKAVVRLRRDHSARLLLTGKQVRLVAPQAGSTKVTVAFRSATSTGAAAQCAGVDASLRAVKKGALRFP